MPVLAIRDPLEHYQLVGTLGKGSYGVVHKGKKRRSNDLVALKVIARSKLTSADERLMPSREIIALKTLPRHPNIVHLQEVFEFNQHVFIVLELAKCGSLYDWLQRMPLGLGEADSKAVSRQLISAIQHVHAHGLAHLDISPRNVLVDEGKVVKLCDFGFCEAVASDQTLTGMRGSLNYAAPEIIRGDAFGASADVWSLGVVTYEMLTGVCPFNGHNASEFDSPLFPDSLWKDKSPVALNFVHLLLEREPESRPRVSAVAGHPFLLP